MTYIEFTDKKDFGYTFVFEFDKNKKGWYVAERNFRGIIIPYYAVKLIGKITKIVSFEENDNSKYARLYANYKSGILDDHFYNYWLERPDLTQRLFFEKKLNPKWYGRNGEKPKEQKNDKRR